MAGLKENGIPISCCGSAMAKWSCWNQGTSHLKYSHPSETLTWSYIDGCKFQDHRHIKIDRNYEHHNLTFAAIRVLSDTALEHHKFQWKTYMSGILEVFFTNIILSRWLQPTYEINLCTWMEHVFSLVDIGAVHCCNHILMDKFLGSPPAHHFCHQLLFHHAHPVVKHGAFVMHALQRDPPWSEQCGDYGILAESLGANHDQNSQTFQDTE